MKIYIQVKDERVIGWGDVRSMDSDIEIEVPISHEVIKNPFVFVYKNGQLTKDTVYQQQLVKEQVERDKQIENNRQNLITQ